MAGVMRWLAWGLLLTVQTLAVVVGLWQVVTLWSGLAMLGPDQAMPPTMQVKVGVKSVILVLMIGLWWGLGRLRQRLR